MTTGGPEWIEEVLSARNLGEEAKLDALAKLARAAGSDVAENRIAKTGPGKEARAAEGGSVIA